METKTCIGCKETSEVSNFYKVNRQPGKFSPRCKSCHKIQGRKNTLARQERDPIGYGNKANAASRRYREANLDKVREQERENYQKNIEHFRKNSREKSKIRKNIKKAKLIELMGGKCVACGGEFPPCAYDFHHKDPKEKEGNPGNVLSCSWDKIKKEIIDKCILLCSNCHRIHHNADYFT